MLHNLVVVAQSGADGSGLQLHVHNLIQASLQVGCVVTRGDVNTRKYTHSRKQNIFMHSDKAYNIPYRIIC